jgi:DNA polymerase delta subunit 1
MVLDDHILGHTVYYTEPVATLDSSRILQVFSQILRYAQKSGYVVPFRKTGRQLDGVAYEGATVLHAHTGYYSEPVATLDFASLYPSIMIAHNLCYTTLVPASKVGTVVPKEDVVQAPGTGAFELLCVGTGSQMRRSGRVTSRVP